MLLLQISSVMLNPPFHHAPVLLHGSSVLHMSTASTSTHISFSAATAKGAHIVFMMKAASTRLLQEQV